MAVPSCPRGLYFSPTQRKLRENHPYQPNATKPVPVPGAAAAAASAPDNSSFETAKHGAAALKIQNRQRVKHAEQETARLKAEGKLPGQLRAKAIEEWGTAVFKKFDADADGNLSAKELVAALKGLPKTKPKKIPAGATFQSVEDMIDKMDSDGSGTISLTEWIQNLGQCPGLAAALVENVTIQGTSGEELAVSVEEVAALGDMAAAGELEVPPAAEEAA